VTIAVINEWLPDPDWDVDLDLAADAITVHLRPKEAGAVERSVIGGSLQPGMGIPSGSPATLTC
jgi:hypothetical protein